MSILKNKNVPARPFPKPTAQVAPYVDAIGSELTLKLRLMFGGSELYIPERPNGKSQLEALIGAENVRILAQSNHLLQRRVPLANAWVAQALHVQGYSANNIARRIRVTDSTARQYIARLNARGDGR